ncbi:hypothetical protein V3C40_27635 [Janthinobacterium sp. LS2A]|uniref:hypothetical protein n=1 Tax=Janthinobacterium sp. LS2A TaxID=3118590 RepID=UPI002F95F300
MSWTPTVVSITGIMLKQQLAKAHSPHFGYRIAEAMGRLAKNFSNKRIKATSLHAFANKVSGPENLRNILSKKPDSCSLMRSLEAL